MSTDAWDEEAVFHVARRLIDPVERASYLDAACGGVPGRRERIEAMLAVCEEDRTFLMDDSEATVPGSAICEGPGGMVGPYKLLRQLGDGGMGVVFLADQLYPVQRRVALKIIRPGMDTRAVVARFEAERQALAMMDHPHIARVLDGGTTDTGHPYFVMELVQGRPITRYCDEQRLTIEQRLELFLKVCRAVQHAHQKGVIHRDLKPSNILVAEYDDQAVPKIIDFGVAKATSQRLTDKTMFTALGHIIGTLEYMSPEQAGLNGLDVDTRTDIYALGVLLYQLLTGTTPLERQRLRTVPLDEAVRMIRSEEPPRPSQRLSSLGDVEEIAARRQIETSRLKRLVRRELDWIVMKALDKDRTRRYEAAATLAEDIRRFLADERVTARPPTAGYLLRKIVRRNRGPVAVSALLVMFLLVGLWSSQRRAWQTQRALVEVTLKSYYSEMSAALQEFERGDRDGARRRMQPYQPWPVAGDDPRGPEWDFLQNLLHQPVESAKYEFGFLPVQLVASPSENRLLVFHTNQQITEITLDDQLHVQSSVHQRAGGAISGTHGGRLAFSNDGGNYAFLGLHDSDFVLGLTATGHRRIHDATGHITGLISFPGSHELLIGTKYALEIWNWRSSVPRDIQQLPYDWAPAAVSPLGRHVAFTSGDRQNLMLWDLDERREVSQWSFPRGVGSVAYSRTGRYFALAGGDAVVRVHDATEDGYPCIAELTGHKAGISSLAFSPTSDLLASGSGDRTIRVWDIEQQATRNVLRGHSQVVRGVAFLPDGGTVASIGDMSLRLWKLCDAEPCRTRFRPRQVREVLMLDDQTLAYYEVMSLQLNLFDHRTLTEDVRHLPGDIWAMAYAPECGLIVGDAHGSILQFDQDIREPAVISHIPMETVVSLKTTRHGKRLASATDRSVHVWDFVDNAWTLVWSHDFDGYTGRCVAVEDDLIAWGGTDGRVTCCNIATRNQLWSTQGHIGEVYSLAFSRDGRELLSSSLDGSIRLWNSLSGDVQAERQGDDCYWWATFSPDDRAVVTTGNDCLVTLRDRQTLEPRFRFPQLDGAGKSLSFSTDGGWLAVSTMSGQVQVWDLTRRLGTEETEP